MSAASVSKSSHSSALKASLPCQEIKSQEIMEAKLLDHHTVKSAEHKPRFCALFDNDRDKRSAIEFPRAILVLDLPFAPDRLSVSMGVGAPGCEYFDVMFAQLLQERHVGKLLRG